MAWLAVDKDGKEIISTTCPEREDFWWSIENEGRCLALLSRSIKKLTGKTLTWDDEPIEI